MRLPHESTSVPPDATAVRVSPPAHLGGTVKLPGSKSLTNRALIMASFARGTTLLKNVLDCDDSRYLIAALSELGVSIDKGPEEDSLRVSGVGGPFPVRRGRFYVGNAGTAARFLTAALAAGGGDYVVDGDERMRQRPIGHLVQALCDLGADVSAPTGCPPVTIGQHPLLGGRVSIPGSVSSQFISAILMASPLAQRSVKLCVTEELVSRPYLDLTLEGMQAFGANVRVSHQGYSAQPVFEVIAGSGYRSREEHFVEGDASAASYFYGAAAVSGSSLRVEGVGKESSQGDARCADALAAMGCRVKKEREAITVAGPRPPQGILKGIDYDCNEIPDVVPTLAVVALFAHGRTRLRGVAHLKHKESDRIRSVASEIRKLGGSVKELSDGLEIEGTLGPQPSPLHGARIHTWEDHRIAMALSLAGLEIDGVVIENPHVVSKSFPEYFEVLRSLGVAVTFE